MKYSINIYTADGELEKTVGTDFVSTNTFIKAIKAMQEIEGKEDIELIMRTLADVICYLLPSITRDEILAGCDVGDMLSLVKQVVNKMTAITPSKN